MSGSESEEYGSAKDEKVLGGDSNLETSDDEPLSKQSPKKEKASQAKKKFVKKAAQPKAKEGVKKKGRGRPPKASLDPLATDSEPKEEEEYEVEAIVGHREYNGKLVYKIRWKNYDAVHDTWEAYDSLSCPDLLDAYNLKHQVNPKKVTPGKKRKMPVERAKKTTKKVRNSVSDASESETWEGDGESDDEFEVEKIVEMRMKRNGTREFLVHWKRWSADHDTWEPEKNLNCPEMIERFMKRVSDAKNSDFKELRTNRKHTDRFTLSTHENGRRLSKRNKQQQRVCYFDAEGEDE